MDSVLPVLGFGIWSFLCVATVVQNNRLLKIFREKYPQIAQQEIPHIFDDNWSHPEKIFFFFRKRAVALLRSDNILWRERQRLLALEITTLGFWVMSGLLLSALSYFSK